MTLEFLELTEAMKNETTKSATPQKANALPRKVRGTLTIKAGDDMEFRAYRDTGVSSQQEIAHAGDSKLYRTVGEKKPKTICHVVVPEDTTDPAAYIYDKVEEMTRALQTKAKPKLKGTVLKADDDLHVTLSRKEHRLEVVMTIDLQQKPNYQQELMNLMYRTNQCFAINVTSIVSARQ